MSSHGKIVVLVVVGIIVAAALWQFYFKTGEAGPDDILRRKRPPIEGDGGVAPPGDFGTDDRGQVVPL